MILCFKAFLTIMNFSLEINSETERRPRNIYFATLLSDGLQVFVYRAIWLAETRHVAGPFEPVVTG